MRINRLRGSTCIIYPGGRLRKTILRIGARHDLRAARARGTAKSRAIIGVKREMEFCVLFAPAQIAAGMVSGMAGIFDQPGLIVFAGIVVAVAARRWRKRLLARARLRAAPNWPTVTATIDVPAVLKDITPENKQRLIASLTYFYRNPELQMGEYRRPFATKEQARQWAVQFKGRTVPVHVNPEDPSDSVLLERDLAGSDFAMHAPVKVGTAALDPMPQVISPMFRLVCGLAEIAGLAGLATSAVMLGVNLVMHGKLRPYGYYWAGGILFGVCAAAAIAVQINLMRTEEGRWLLHSYRRWCPEWMRWSLNLTGGSVALKPLLHMLNLLHLISPGSSHWMHAPWAQALAPYVPYAIGCWLFFMITAFHAALLRSQEELHISVVEA